MKLELPRVQARRFIRKMMGGTQAHLLEADDGRYYVVKFSNNPQGLRILCNELIATLLLHELGISAPQPACVAVTADFLAAFPAVRLTTPVGEEIPVPPGWHFGSQYPGQPASLSIYDFLPGSMFHRLYNRADFFGVLVFDKWVSNGDKRQAIFFRALLPTAGGDRKSQWFAQAIDNGHAFQGPGWTFRDSPLQGVYPRPEIYGRHLSLLKAWRWIELIRNLPPAMFQEVAAALPSAWIASQREALRLLLCELAERRRLLPELVADWVEWMQRAPQGRGDAGIAESSLPCIAG